MFFHPRCLVGWVVPSFFTPGSVSWDGRIRRRPPQSGAQHTTAVAPSFAGANLHYNKARERKLEHEMADTEQREYREHVYRLSDVEGPLNLSELLDLYGHDPRTVEPQASTRAHYLVSARPVLPAPAPAPKSQRGN